MELRSIIDWELAFKINNLIHEHLKGKPQGLGKAIASMAAALNLQLDTQNNSHGMCCEAIKGACDCITDLHARGYSIPPEVLQDLKVKELWWGPGIH